MRESVDQGEQVGGRVGGLAGDERRLDAGWLGWSGRVAPPDSPLGSGGPGHFRAVAAAGSVEPGAPSRERIGAAGVVELQLLPVQVPRPANPPPATQARSLGALKRVQADLVDVSIDGEVLADGSGGPAGGAHTAFDMPRASAPGYTVAAGKVTGFRGKFTWKGALTIQTRYGGGATSRSVSCYGRGTTASDVRSGDITLGFHESCHHRDYVAYLAAHPLPDPPTPSIGISAASYDAAVQTFFKELREYAAAMASDSEARTDEVGHPKSDVATRGCFTHHVP
jgi:hypothetical protein